jgi:hypothetical protein
MNYNFIPNSNPLTIMYASPYTMTKTIDKSLPRKDLGVTSFRTIEGQTLDKSERLNYANFAKSKHFNMSGPSKYFSL